LVYLHVRQKLRKANPRTFLALHIRICLDPNNPTGAYLKGGERIGQLFLDDYQNDGTVILMNRRPWRRVPNPRADFDETRNIHEDLRV